MRSAERAFLFTDIAGSTRLWEQHPVEMPDALETHDWILRNAVEENGGEVFATMGDGIAVAFSTVDAAISAAASAQRALGLRCWGAIPELRVRMGVHRGLAQHRGHGYFGPSLNRCARLMSVAHGGQVLLSGAAQAMSVDWPVRDLGLHPLRDLDAPEHVFELLLSRPELDEPVDDRRQEPLVGESCRGGHIDVPKSTRDLRSQPA